jgi:hypothetical protein
MKRISTEKLRATRVAVVATTALMLTLSYSTSALARGLTCTAQSQVIIDARIIETLPLESKRGRMMDLLVKCPTPADIQGMPSSIQANIDLTLDSNVTNARNFAAQLGNAGPLVPVGRQNITDAVLITNENTTDGPFATPNYVTGDFGVGQSPQYGMLADDKTLRWNGVFLPVPGVAGNPDTTTFRITNIQASVARPGVPVTAKLTIKPFGSYHRGDGGFEWDASTLKTVPVPSPYAPADFGYLSGFSSAALKIYPEISPPSSGLGSGSVRLVINFDVPRGSGDWIPPATYLFRQGSPYAGGIQSFDVATTGLPNVTPELPQQPRYQIPYGQTQAPYGAPIYPNPYDYGERRDRVYDPWAAGVPLNRPVIPWEIPPWQIPGAIPWQYPK